MTQPSVAWLPAALVACLSLTLIASAVPAAADHCNTTAMAELLIGDDDVPSGLAPVPEATGELEVQAIREMAPDADMSLIQAICAYMRSWVDPVGNTVTGTVFDLRSETLARAWLQASTRALEARDESQFSVTAVAGARGLVLAAENPVTGDPSHVAIVLVRRGRYMFTTAVQARTANLETAVALVARQAANAEAGDTAPGGVGILDHCQLSDLRRVHGSRPGVPVGRHYPGNGA